MPEPIYIMCSKSSETDPENGLLNVYNVVEMVLISRFDSSTKSPSPKPLPFHINACWMRTSSDSDDQSFDYQFVLAISSSGEEVSLGGGQFTFGNRQSFRITGIGEMPTLGGPGVARVICRVRRAGTEDNWVERSYPIIIQEVTFPVQQAISGTSSVG
jgi:hypothetical protein